MAKPIHYSDVNKEVRTSDNSLVLVAIPKVESITANKTLTRDDHGKIFLTGAVDLVFTLPATEEGLVFDFHVVTLSTTTGLSISPNAADLIRMKGITAANDKNIINTAATDAVGDHVRLVGDGLDGWICTGFLGTWAREA